MIIDNSNRDYDSMGSRGGKYLMDRKDIYEVSSGEVENLPKAFLITQDLEKNRYEVEIITDKFILSRLTSNLTKKILLQDERLEKDRSWKVLQYGESASRGAMSKLDRLRLETDNFRIKPKGRRVGEDRV